LSSLGSTQRIALGLVATLLLPVVTVGLLVLVVTRLTDLPDGVALRVGHTDVTDEQLQQRMNALDALYGIEAPKDGPARDSFVRNSAKAVAVSIVIDPLSLTRSAPEPEGKTEVIELSATPAPPAPGFEEAIAEYYRGSGAVYEAVAALPQPTVAAIAGYCLGGGFELALAADLRVADETAVFGLPEVGLGILPSSGGVTRLVRAVGPARTRDLVLRGRRMSVTQAHSWGLVTETTPAGSHLSTALEIAGELAAQPPLAVSVAKQVITAATDASRETALLLEQLAYATLNRIG